MKPNTQTCPNCGGRGRFGATSQYRCYVCRGKGYVRKLSADPANFARRQSRHMANLLDPNWCHGSTFPDFAPGMSTGQYIKAFQAMNSGDRGHRHTETPVGPLTFVHAQRAAAMYDPAEPELTTERLS